MNKMGIRSVQKLVFGILYVCLGVSILAGVLVHVYMPSHAAFFWEEIPVFSAVYGFIGCILIIVVSKAVGHYWLQKGEDYYETH
jgi:cytochrome b561